MHVPLNPESSTLSPRLTPVSAFTLIEIMISMGLIGLLCAGVYSCIISGLNLNYASAQRVAAFTLCKEEVEKMRGVGYLRVTATNFPAGDVFLTHLGGSARLPMTGTRASTITEYSDPVRKVVDVTVQWDFKGRPFEESLTAVIYRKE